LLNIVFTETALELVPRSILHHPSVRRNAKRRKKPPEETLLDRSIHHFAMLKLVDAEKRGRPDIIHFCLLLTQGSPLNKMGKLRTYISLYDGSCVFVDPSTRPPRDCNRFNSLMEQLLVNTVIPKKGKPLMKITPYNLVDLVENLKPSKIVALSSHGEPSSFEEVASMLAAEESPLVFIGAYPSGPMKPEVSGLADEVISIYPEPLEAWTVTSRMIYEYEKHI